MTSDIENNRPDDDQQVVPSSSPPPEAALPVVVDTAKEQAKHGTPTTSNNNNSKDRMIHVFAMFSFLWGVVMTSLYIHENKQQQQSQLLNPGTANSRGGGVDVYDDKTTFRSLDGPNHLGVGAISHINVVVNDSIDIGSQYYQDILGFEPAYNDGGKMEYRNISNYGFCVDAGFENGDCLVDIIFLKHPIINLYLELFYYYKPNDGIKTIELKKTYDASGGIRHVALEVLDAVDTYNKLKAKPNHQGTFITKDTPIPLDPFPYTFFYWIDKYGTQWEFEEGRPVEYFHVAGITG